MTENLIDGPDAREVQAPSKLPWIVAAVAACLVVGVADVASADVTVNVQTNATWKMTTSAPPANWNTQVGFDDSGWANAVVNYPANTLGTHTVDFIWNTSTPGPGNATHVYFRKVFTTAAAASAAILDAAADDDMEVWVNGVKVVNSSDCLAGSTLGTDVLAHIVVGQNLVAVHATDCNPASQTFGLYMDVVTATPVPVMGPTGMLLLALGLALAATFMIRKKEAFGSSANP